MCVEVSGAYAVAVENPSKPTVIALSRQNCRNLHGSSAERVREGAYVLPLGDAPPYAEPQIVLLGTGSEVQTLLEAATARSVDEKGLVYICEVYIY